MIRFITILIIALPFQKVEAQKAFTFYDTAEVIKIAIKQAFDSSHLPDLGSVTRKYKFGDSILFTSQSIPLSYLPSQLDTLHFKILQLDHICKLLLADTNWMSRPNYLSIQTFERKKNVFTVIITSHNCGRFASGGGLHLDIIKEVEKFRIIHRGSYSIG